MRTEEDVKNIIRKLDSFLVGDCSYESLNVDTKVKGGFPFYGEINTSLVTEKGIRKILLWVLGGTK